MDIKDVKVPVIPEEEKREVIKKIKEGFDNMRFAFESLEKDMEGDDLKMQTSAVWISGQILRLFSEFFTHVKNLEKDINTVQNEIQNVAEATDIH